jgi:aldehyde dehydrogenase (NAD+)
MGRCHGRWGFEEFSHLKSLLERGTLPDVPLRWPPHEGRLKALLLKFLG